VLTRPLRVATALLALTAVSSTAAAADDPYLRYWTIETRHFRVHYPSALEPEAQHVADIAEAVYGRLTVALANHPSEVTDIVLTDNTESANGSATALPHDVIRLYVTAPDDISPLNEHDDWHLELVTHEFTHIVHTDNITGVPALLNAILGKTFAPNQAQPRWILEGLAVLEESKRTSGGRNRSSVFDMYLRANVLEGRMAGLDVMSHLPRSWPGGNYWYLYGSRFLTWIVDTYGENAMRTIAADYGHQLIPYGINRSIRRATGRTYEELYDGWKAHLERLYGAQIDDAKAQPGGLREGKRLTHHGRTTQRPRWVPEAIRREKATPEVAYYLDDGHGRSGFYRMPVPNAREAWESQRDLFVRAQGEGSLAFDRAGNAIFDTIEIHKRVYPFTDLSRVAAGAASPNGSEAARARLSEGLRAHDPDVTRDGSAVTYTVNRRGTTYLSIASITPEGALGPSRVLVKPVRGQQAYTPRFSPDGSKVAYSSWSRGGYRDIRVVDVDTGEIEELTHDRALDLQPVFSPDGKTLYFASDRTGISNVYAHDFATHETWQVTNVRTGAYMPEPSPDGKSLLYVGYSSDGFDLHAMEIDRSGWQRARPFVDDRPDPPSEPPRTQWPRHPYNPLPTLRPYAYSLDYGPGTFGQTLVVSAVGQDVVGHHAISASMSIDTARAEPQGSLGYAYLRLPMDLYTSVFRTVAPGAGYRISGREPDFDEEYVGVTSSLSYGLPRAFDSFAFLFGYTAARYKGKLPVGPNLDPQESVTLLPVGQGMLGVVRGAFSFSNVERTLYSIGASRGFTAQLTADVGGPAVASDWTYHSFGYSATGYVTMPWHRDHVIMSHAEAAIAGGNYPRRGVYYVGGMVDVPVSDTIQKSVFQGGFVLRGYPAGAYAGRQYHQGTLEYRFPILYPERGVSTLPIFLGRVSGAAFVDYGGAFDDLDVEKWRQQFHTGLGGELLIDATVGYFLPLTARLGFAKGLSQEAIPGGKLYLVLSSPY
jgi:hypothetical protein